MDDEGLSAAPRKVLRHALVRLQVELTRLLADEGGLADTVVLDQSTVGRLSRMDAMQQQETAKAILRRHGHRLERIAAALERVDEAPDEFGWCPDCGEEIGWQRLLAFPDAVLCVGCQGQRGL